MRLSELCSHLIVKTGIPDGVDCEVSGFSMDSRTVCPGDMFVALTEPDLKDRLEFAPAAVAGGASALLTETPLPNLAVPQIVVPDTKVASAVLASAFYGHPEAELELIGVTGTKGKTSTTYFISQLLERCGIPTGIIGTTGAFAGGECLEQTNTTPHPTSLYRILRTLRGRGVSTVAMEASSHALKLNRTSGCTFRVAVFTNIGHDHMDFHHTMEDYVATKARLMARVTRGAAVINADDPCASTMSDAASCEVITYGFGEGVSLRAEAVSPIASGTAFTVTGRFGTMPVQTRLVGRFSVYNALAALGAAIAMGVPAADAARLLSEVGGVPGRVELVDAGRLGFQVVVDYAHTAESLESVLSALRSMGPRHLITVLGCGGDRDRTKRPVMGAIAGKYSDFAFVTSDNPRSEPPGAILEEIRAGLVGSGASTSNYRLVLDRRQAIGDALTMAQPGDIVAICGKGHETGQIVAGVKLPFDDREVAGDALRLLAGETGPPQEPV